MTSSNHFFSHDFNARNNYKFLDLRVEFGWWGYGVFWAVCETIAENDKPINRDKLGALALSLGIEKEKLVCFIDFCISVNLLQEDGGFISSEELNTRLEYKREKSRKAKENAKKRWGNAKAMQTQCDGIAIALNEQCDSNANKTKQNKTKQNKTKDIISREQSYLKPKKEPEERILDFKKEVLEFRGQYSDDMLKEFFEYWTEHGKKDKKARWEKEKTFGLSRRLDNWAKKREEFEQRSKANNPKTFNQMQKDEYQEFLKNADEIYRSFDDMIINENGVVVYE